MSAAREIAINKKNSAALVAIEAITSRILILRGQRVMVDTDLAALYSVQTRRLNEQVRRNPVHEPAPDRALCTLLRSHRCAPTGGGDRREFSGK